MNVWKEKTGCDVSFHSDLMLSEVTFYRTSGERSGERKEPVSSQDRASLTERQSVILKVLDEDNRHTARSIALLLNIPQRTIEQEKLYLRKNGFINKVGSTKNGLTYIFDCLKRITSFYLFDSQLVALNSYKKRKARFPTENHAFFSP